MKKKHFESKWQRVKIGVIMAAGSVSKILMPKSFTVSNDLESYFTHFELLADMRKSTRTKISSSGEVARKIDERPHYFALRLQKSAIDFYRRT